MSSLASDINLTKTEQEKKRQNEAQATLFQEYPLPKNMNDMKSYAWGKFTWRDVIVSGTCVIVPVMIMLAFQSLIPTFVCVIIGIAISIPLLFIANKHIFTGDLPIEEKVKIYVDNAGQTNLMSWDKTKREGQYIMTSTQSFVPDIAFTEKNYVMLHHNQGGFAVVRLDLDDSTMAKPTEQLHLLQNFEMMLNQCIDNQKCVPIQIYMQAIQTPLLPWKENARDDVASARMSGRDATMYRAADYYGLLDVFDTQTRYHYRYYVVITYREDAEGVGDKTMNTTSVRREQMKEKANPFRKKMEAAEAIDYQIGTDREQQSADFLKQDEFGPARTNAELERRVEKIVNAINSMGSTHTSITARKLDSEEIGGLFYSFFNDTDKYASAPVLQQAIHAKSTLWSPDIYDDFPDMFHKAGKANRIEEIIGLSPSHRNKMASLADNPNSLQGTYHGHGNPRNARERQQRIRMDRQRDNMPAEG